MTKEACLFQACKTGNLDLVKQLIEVGVDVNCENFNSHTPLIIATYSRQTHVARYLLKQNANPNHLEKYTGSTALHKAAIYNCPDIMASLLSAKANPNVKNRPPARDTPLHLAVQHSRVQCVRLLLGYKADPNAINDAGVSPFQLSKRVPSLSALIIQETKHATR